jgi:hypothetical protein
MSLVECWGRFGLFHVERRPRVWGYERAATIMCVLLVKGMASRLSELRPVDKEHDGTVIECHCLTV